MIDLTNCRALLAMLIICTPALSQQAGPRSQFHLSHASVDIACPSEQPAVPIGKVIYRKGAVHAAGPSRLVKGTTLLDGETIETGPNAFISLELASGEVISVQPASKIVLNCSHQKQQAEPQAKFVINIAHMSGGTRG